MEWQKLTSQYIWMGKTKQVMQLSKDQGGMALPNVKDSYYAAQIRTLSICDLQLRWKQTEEGGSVGPPVQADTHL